MAAVRGTFVGPWCALFGLAATLLSLDLFSPFADGNRAVILANIGAGALGCFMCLQEADLDVPGLRSLAPGVWAAQGSAAKLCALMPSYTFWTVMSLWFTLGSSARLMESEYPRAWGTVCLVHVACHVANAFFQLYTGIATIFSSSKKPADAGTKKD